MKEREPSRRHPFKGMQDSSLVARPNPIVIEGTPLAQSRFDRMMAESNKELEEWDTFTKKDIDDARKKDSKFPPVRHHPKTPLQNPKQSL